MAVTKTSLDAERQRRKNIAAGARASAVANRKIQWTTEQLQEKWAAEARGETYVHPSLRPIAPMEEVAQQAAKVDPVVPRAIVDVVVPPGAALRAERTMSVEPQAPRAADMRNRLDELLRANNVEPAEELIRLATARTPDGVFVLSNEDRISIWSKLLEYRMPKLKSVEHAGHVDHGITVVVKKFGQDEVPVKQIKSEN